MSLSKRLAAIAKEQTKRKGNQEKQSPLEKDYPLLADLMRTVNEEGDPRKGMKLGFYHREGDYRVRLSDPETNLVAFFTIWDPANLLREVEAKLENAESIDWRIDQWNGKFTS